jgi:citrate synthase
MADKAKLQLGDQAVELPIIIGTEQEKAFDISNLRNATTYITLDDGYMNTGACKSAITFIDGEKGILRHRGYPIEQLAEQSSFEEVSYLLLFGNLPTQTELEEFRLILRKQSVIPEEIKKVISSYPKNTHPMVVVANMMCLLSSYYPALSKPILNKEEIKQAVLIVMGHAKTIASYAFRHMQGQAFVDPDTNIDTAGNFLHMSFGQAGKKDSLDADTIKAVDTLLILHADHEQNCSTSALRLVGSSQANLFASLSAAFCALWGPLHGGANQAVIEMLEKIEKEGGDVEKYMALVKDKNANVRLMGFGHRVYKNYDPRATIIKKMAEIVVGKKNDPLLKIAKELESIALSDRYFIERRLYPNVDFYSGLIYRALGIPRQMFTVMFALGRLPGWLSHWKEMVEIEPAKIARPRQIYVGAAKRDYVTIDKRK